ncbi:lytic transglycosylase domain-containing protein [Clostridium sp. KNHs214]|uniref:lytic transglycosylase domain-containing protein n=1 Tax=Clostridium sp. KNHs214 TaxID=1540257 RepID=UPI000690F724|nr:lytic transglycosylase domain-containing protein [Clostridium sp. KNHs214]
MKKRKLILIIIIFAVILAILNVENIAKNIYPYKHKEYIERYATENGLDPMLIAAIIKTESNFNDRAKSNKDAYGLMQLTPETAKWISEKMQIGNFNEQMLYEPETNIKMGCWYVKNLQKEFKDMDLVLAAYNAGRGRVSKWLKDPEHSKDGKNLHYIPFKETDKYVKKVEVSYNIYKALYNNQKKNKTQLIKDIFKNFHIGSNF